jgi:hypothetical protein
MKEDVEYKLNIANRRYDAMPAEARDDVRRAELAALENARSGLGVGDALNFALSAGGMGYLAHAGMQFIPKKLITEPQLQEKVQELFGYARAAVQAGTHEGLAQDGMEVLKKYGIDAEAQVIKALGTVPKEITAITDAAKVEAAKAYIEKTIKNTAPYVHEFANRIHEQFPGGMKGLAVSASVITGLVVMANGIDLSNRYRDARIANLKQDLTHTEIVEMRRNMEQLVAEKQR